MKLSDFDYNLPKERIAQKPVSPRDHSKLFVLNKKIPTHEELKVNSIQYILGICDLTGELEAEYIESELPENFNLSQNYPNPFNSSTLIECSIPLDTETSGVKTSLMIFNALGQKVKTLVDEEKSPGNYAVLWDARDDEGDKVGSGTYFYRLEAGERSLTKKMLYVK